jgi:hypothetical protein
MTGFNGFDIASLGDVQIAGINVTNFAGTMSRDAATQVLSNMEPDGVSSQVSNALNALPDQMRSFTEALSRAGDLNMQSTRSNGPTVGGTFRG